MDPETVKVIVSVVAALVVVGCIVSIFGFTWGRPGRSRAAAPPAAPPPAEADHADFGALADERLRPLLDALVERARAHHYEARYEVTGEGEATKHRLEITRPDHPAGQPLPYIAFSAGADHMVDVIYGGVFPGPSDHNRSDPEIGWRTVRWDQVDNVLATFSHKVLARFE